MYYFIIILNCKLIFKIQGPYGDQPLTWFELNGLPCVNKVLLYFTLLYFFAMVAAAT